ncbi:MAG: prepilin-type N-terminal cleavage/methylation domain-containing protein [Thermoleophilia bacterium]|nr:prepilin-type N-terminal cleavage/methylation domain-containing protein [Thermoleophilia bacterium]
MSGRLRAASRRGGFTLIELLVSMVFIGMLVAAASMLFTSALRHNDEVMEESTIQTEVRAAIDTLAGELRQAYTGDDLVAPIESIGSTGLTFLSPDRASPFHLRRISYRVTDGTLERAVAVSSDTDGPPWSVPALGEWAPVVRSVSNTTLFAYLDESGAATTDPAAVHTVAITVSVRPTTSGGREFTYQTSVTLRTPMP